MESEEDGEAAIMMDKLQEIDALAISENSPKENWVIDSGCSYHMTSRRDWFSEFKRRSQEDKCYLLMIEQSPFKE